MLDPSIFLKYYISFCSYVILNTYSILLYFKFLTSNLVFDLEREEENKEISGKRKMVDLAAADYVQIKASNSEVLLLCFYVSKNGRVIFFYS